MRKQNKPRPPPRNSSRRPPEQQAELDARQASLDIFFDRRRQPERREQCLSVPARMCRRKTDRRKNSFSSRPWWLQVNYNDDRNRWI